MAGVARSMLGVVGELFGEDAQRAGDETGGPVGMRARAAAGDLLAPASDPRKAGGAPFSVAHRGEGVGDCRQPVDPGAALAGAVVGEPAGEVARTTRLVEDMLLLARSEQREFVSRRPVDLPRFVNELWSTTTVGVNRRFALGPVPDGSVDADPDRLAQALRNLLDNAIAHTAETDGHVALRIEALPGGRVRFTVTDDGPGVPPDERTRIFERFHRTDEARDRRAGGAGLGLAIVQAIADAHDGEVRAVAPGAVGARFELEITRFSASAPGGTPAPLAALSNHSRVD